MRVVEKKAKKGGGRVGWVADGDLKGLKGLKGVRLRPRWWLNDVQLGSVRGRLFPRVSLDDANPHYLMNNFNVYARV